MVVYVRGDDYLIVVPASFCLRTRLLQESWQRITAGEKGRGGGEGGGGCPHIKYFGKGIEI